MVHSGYPLKPLKLSVCVSRVLMESGSFISEKLSMLLGYALWDMLSLLYPAYSASTSLFTHDGLYTAKVNMHALTDVHKN